MKFVNVYSYDEIYDLLIEFEECFPHLREKIVDFESFSKKLSEFAKVIICRLGNKNIALSIFYCNDKISRIGYISLIGVKKEFRGLGIGKQLFDQTKNIMKECGMCRIKLEVDKDNLNAKRFYFYLGFKSFEKSYKDSEYLVLEI